MRGSRAQCSPASTLGSVVARKGSLLRKTNPRPQVGRLEPEESDVKQCSKCKDWFPADARCFDKDRSSPSGLQSYCVECKDGWEILQGSIWHRTRAWLINNEPESWSLWERAEPWTDLETGLAVYGAEAAFLKKWHESRGRCHSCGAGLREWQLQGHCLDRIGNTDKAHTPANTRLCCWPCNSEKRDKNYYAFKSMLDTLLDEHGRGQIPWNDVSQRYKRAKRRVCKHLKRQAPQGALPL